MSDISKCNGDGCPTTTRALCLRYVAAAGEWQSWIAPEVSLGGTMCPNYLPIYPSHMGQIESGR